MSKDTKKPTGRVGLKPMAGLEPAVDFSTRLRNGAVTNYGYIGISSLYPRGIFIFTTIIRCH